ncbi:MAG TPA: glucuronate isomerase, partial [Planctomycetaceae bacterium]|nr:glucuronate isomerase [Planctomycetaceae bacterium]
MQSTRDAILQSLREITLIDPHTHINPHNPASQTLADLLGYHYYTELAHASGMPKSQIESPGLSPRELVSRLVGGLEHLTNTAQYSWLIEICKQLYGFEHDTITPDNWESLYDRAESMMQSADWASTVLEKANVSAVFLTNDFDDPLERFDTNVYIPCLRTDDLVFHLAKPEVRERLVGASGIGLSGSLQSLRDALEQRFKHFVANGARACAISLPPSFSPAPVSDGRAATALDAVLRQGLGVDPAHRAALSRRVFWTIAELCDQYGLPFDLMIGVNREVYREGVHQGRDLYDSRVSLIQYAELFNAFPEVKFPISVLASVTNQELVSYAWIFPNVITSGHWWYSNTPSFIRRDAAARLEAVPRNKQIAYYSDAYKLEFIAPKFDMYRQTLADILTEDFIAKRGWSEEKAIELGYQVLRGNVEQIFPALSKPIGDATQSLPLVEVASAQLATQLWSPSESEVELADAAGVVAGIAIAASPLLAESPSELSGEDSIPSASSLNETIEFVGDLDSAEATVEFSEPDVAMQPNPVTGELTWNVEQDELHQEDVDSNAETYEVETLEQTDEPRFGSPVPDDLLETLDLEVVDDLPEGEGDSAAPIDSVANAETYEF